MSVKAERKTTWHGQEARFHRGNLCEVMTHIPFFTREPFSLLGNRNEYLDMIVSRQVNLPGPVPVAVVSKQYELVQHYDILGVIAGALKEVDVDPRQVQAELCLSAYGEKMRLCWKRK